MPTTIQKSAPKRYPVIPPPVLRRAAAVGVTVVTRGVSVAVGITVGFDVIGIVGPIVGFVYVGAGTVGARVGLPVATPITCSPLLIIVNDLRERLDTPPLIFVVTVIVYLPASSTTGF